jgi:hypothetical protein
VKQGGRGGGWLEEEGDDEPQVKSMASDDDELIITISHHHHSYHEIPSGEEENDGGSRKELLHVEQLSGRKKRLLQVINVDELLQGVKDGGEDKGDNNNNKDEEENSKTKEVKPSYYQPLAIHQPTLDAWTSIHPDDVFFKKHPELKPHQEEIYRMKLRFFFFYNIN